MKMESSRRCLSELCKGMRSSLLLHGSLQNPWATLSPQKTKERLMQRQVKASAGI